MTVASTVAHDTEQPEKGEALPNGTTLLGRQFTIERALSNGGFGITYLARDNYLDRRVVLKECYPEIFCRREGKRVVIRSEQYKSKYKAIIKMFMREARSIAKMRHPNIVGVHRIFEDNQTTYMVLDMINGPDLLSIVNDKNDPLPPQQVKEILIKVLDAVDLVHQNDLLHRDISPDNILLDKWGSPFLIDFGAAREEASRETRAISTVLIVKNGYSPQEFYFAGGKQSPSSDLYALGATFYHLISGEAPPNSQTRMAEFAGRNPDPCEPLAGRFPEYDRTFLEAIDKAMAILPKARIQSATDWLNIINTGGERVTPLKLNQRFDLNESLSRLISETNEYVRNSEPHDPEPTFVQATSAETTPASAPAWVEEFNEETLSKDGAQEDQPAVKASISTPRTVSTKKKKWWSLGVF